MTLKTGAPSANNHYLEQHANLLFSSFERLTGVSLFEHHSELPSDNKNLAESLFKAPFVVVSHGVESDPIFNYANQVALDLFEMAWDAFTHLPSRQSAEPLERAERAALMEQVTKRGFIDNYAGIRISSSGQRFEINHAVVWNIVDEAGNYCGQAATFSNWRYLESVR